MPNLEYLDLAYCTSLEEVQHSLKYCKKLIQLNLPVCEKLKRFPYVNVESLEYLNLQYCCSLEKFPEILGRMKQGTARKIIMSYSRIRELPLYFFDHQPHLIELHLNGITNLASLPSSICKSKGLVKLHVSNWSKLEKLPEEIGDLENLEDLDASYTLISRPPSSIVRLNKLKRLSFEKDKSEDRVYFVFPLVNEGLLSLKYLDLSYCNIIDGGFPEDSGSLSSLEELYLKGNNFEHLPRSISQLGALKYLNLSDCKKLTQLPEDIGSLSSLEMLYLKGNNFEHLPRIISQLGALKYLDLSDCKKLTQLPEDIGCLSSLKHLNLSYCNIIDGRLPEDIGSLSSLKYLNLSYCNIIDGGLLEDIGCLSSLKHLNLSYCNIIDGRLPEDIGSLSSLELLDLSYCNIIDGGLPEDIGSLSSLKYLNLRGNNFEYLPRSISQLGALQNLNLLDCKSLTRLPEFPQQLNIIDVDWSNASICNSLFQNISSLQHDICSSDSLSLRGFGSWRELSVPSWFKYQGMGKSVSVNLPKNWYVSDNFLGFAVCFSGELIDCIRTHLIPLCDDGMSSMTQEFALSNNSEDSNEWDIKFWLVPLGGLWDASNANEKTPNDYGCIKLDFIGGTGDFDERDDAFEEMKIGVRLLYKNESELCIGKRKSRYEEEATCSSSKKLLQLFPTSPGL